MCEIALIDPSEYSSHEIKEISVELYERMRSSLGVVGIFDTNGEYRYKVYKSADPDKGELRAVAQKLKKEGAHRVAIHGRLATQGEVSDYHAHPLEIDCDKCNVEYVMHNGIVAAYEYARETLEEYGHNYSTNVDSEVIAHDFGDVPTTFDDDSDLDHHVREPAFILMNKDSVFIHGSSYQLSNRAKMARHGRWFGPERSAKDHRRVIMTPTSGE